MSLLTFVKTSINTSSCVYSTTTLRTTEVNVNIESSKLACDTGGHCTNYPTWPLPRANPNVDVLNNSLNYYALADLGQDPELGLCYDESRYDKFPLFQQLKFDIAPLSVA